ncbi:uncharacterized [Tachysurus ichikawai]
MAFDYSKKTDDYHTSLEWNTVPGHEDRVASAKPVPEQRTPHSSRQRVASKVQRQLPRRLSALRCAALPPSLDHGKACENSTSHVSTTSTETQKSATRIGQPTSSKSIVSSDHLGPIFNISPSWESL